MPTLLETTAFIFGLVALGYVSGWSGLLRTQIGDALTEFAIAIALPVLLFRTMVEADFQGGAPWALWFTYFTGIAIAWIVGQTAVRRVFGREPEAGVVGGLASSFSNLLLLGIPLMSGMYGQFGLETISIIIAIHLPIMMAASVIMFEWTRRDTTGGTSAGRVVVMIARNLLTNPLIVGILAGLAWRLTGLPIPALGGRFIDALAGIAAPLALFAMGLSLRRFGISGNLKPAITLALMKLVLMPAAVMTLALVAGLPAAAATVATAAAALPTGVNPYLIASRFGVGQALASNTMTIATACAALTVPLWIILAQRVFA